ncbi:hypothetical protein MUO69_07205 [Candidatus Bathyarchaeota archaeon]|nr:hypothetical protein [Candidatus Bathyarchaeota archaeon]
MEDLNKAELRHLRTQTAISIYNVDNAVLEKVEDPCYVPQNAQDEMRVFLREILASDPVIKTILKFLTVVGASSQTDCQDDAGHS